MQVSMDEVVQAIRWRLNLPTDGGSDQAAAIWERLRASPDPVIKEQLDRVCRFLNDAVEQMVRCRLQLPARVVEEDRPLLESLWTAFAAWVQQDPVRRSPRLSGWIKNALASRKAAAAPRTPPSAPARPPAGAASSPATPRPGELRPPLPPPAPHSADTANMTLSPDSARPLPTGPQWQYKSPPDNEPDPHPEGEAVALATPDGGQVLGARARGKKHKHDGTHCDDWFKVGSAGPWTVIAVADGAGSRKLSRVGARVSCERAVEALLRDLAAVRIADRASAAHLLDKDDARSRYRDPDIQAVQEALHRAVHEAYWAVEAAAKQRMDQADYQRLLGRPVTPEDLSATLLLAACTTLQADGQAQNVVLACQVGDGAVAAVDAQAGVQLLGHAESGDYSGETDFLTSRRQREPASLLQKTFSLVGPLRAVLVMTDGVSDDYFPADPGLARLYADLVLNGILPAEAAATAAGAAPTFDPGDGRLDTDCEAPTAAGPQRVRLRSAALYASEMGMEPEQLAASPPLLAAGARGAALLTQAAAPAERLRLWLDSYQVRGSFDDRTLVVLHCGGAR
jgi:hypothetical protein